MGERSAQLTDLKPIFWPSRQTTVQNGLGAGLSKLGATVLELGRPDQPQ